MDEKSDKNTGQGVFQTTHWSTVLAARPNNDPHSIAAWERLANAYWYPVYAHVRRKVSNPYEAEDLVQEFFATLIRRHSLQAVTPDKGRFRTFLLTALKYFLSDQFERATAAKRGGQNGFVIAFDALEGEERLRLEPVVEDSPDKLFDWRWASTLIERAILRLAQEQSESGKSAQFSLLKEFLGREVEAGEYDSVSRQCGISTNAIAAVVRRLRVRLRELALEEARQTTAALTDGEDELRNLFG